MSENIEFLQKQFGERHLEIESRAVSLKKQATTRRNIAILLKGISIFGAIAITAGVSRASAVVAQAIGVAIACAIGVDSLWSNHLSLMAYTEAHHAMESLAVKIKDTYTLRQATILQLDNDAKRQQLGTALSDLLTLMVTQQQEIEQKLRERDIEALIKLRIDEKDKPTAV